MQTPRIMIFTGKGGVGKTSVAAATALRCADLGRRTVVVSTDPAHSLADSFDRELGPEPVEIAPGLKAQEIDVLHQMDRYWGDVQEYLSAILTWRGVNDIVAEEMSVFPGMEELASLLQIVKLHDDGDNDVIIVDAAPTGETLRLLSFPEVGHWYLDRVLPMERRAIQLAGPVLRRLVDVPLPDSAVFDALERLIRQLERMNALLKDPDKASVRLVLNPEKMVIKEAQRTFTYLNLYGFPVDAVISNRVIPPDVTDPYFVGWREAQSRYGELVNDAFAPVPILEAPLFQSEVVGLEMLRRMADEVYRDRDPAGVFYEGRPQQVDKVDDHFRLTIPLPFVSKEQIHVTQVADELVVRIGNQKRNIILPRALVGLPVASARHEQGLLTLVFGNGRGPSGA